MAERLIDYDGTFFRGQKSDSDPGQVPQGYYWNAINMLNIGGMLSCRPGYRCVTDFPTGKLQGATIFRPQAGLEQLVVAIDGVIYVAEWPFKVFRFLPNVQMLPSAKQMYWQLATQSARRLSDDFASAIEVIEPREVLFIQDGANTAPAWYDGSQSGHIRGLPFETPSGGPMAWIGDRLWVARDNLVFASDIANPFSFREQTYLGGTSGFIFEREVTAMAKTPSLEFPQLIVFTAEATSIIQASVRDRDLWLTTDNMQKEVFQIGCLSQKSVVNHYGRISWYSPSGIVWFDAASAANLTARIPVRDNEMMLSKARLFEDLGRVAGAAFGQYLLMSVPSDDTFNKHTWVLNNASLETLNDNSGPSWAGFWLGTRPVEWVYGFIVGTERIFHVSTDEDGINRLWEAFIPDRLDNGCPIMWAVETRGYFGQSAQTSQKVPGSSCRYMFSDFALVGIEEDLDIGAFYSGGTRGNYKQIMGKRISVAKGSIHSEEIITATTEIYEVKPQSRTVRTEDANQTSMDEEGGSCPVESTRNENVDESFQLLIVGHGPAAIRWIRSFALNEPEDLSGEPKACENEVPFKAIRFDGAGVQDSDYGDTILELANKPVIRYTAHATQVVTQDNISATGVGFSESVVSQEAASRVADIIARKMALAEIFRFISPIFSSGKGFE